MLVSAVRASHFLLLRQKKVSKEKATPGLVPAAPVPCATRDWRGLRNSGLRPSDSPRPFSAIPCVARHLARSPENTPSSTDKFWFLAFFRVHRSTRFLEPCTLTRRLSGPHVARRATEKSADKGRGLSEGRRPEFRSPRRFRVAQGSRRSRPCKLGSPFLWLLSFGEAKESTLARKAKPQPIKYPSIKARDKPCPTNP